MARITIPIRPVHQDTSLCTHQVTATGTSTEKGCTGRSGYLARCTARDCTWRRLSKTRTALTAIATDHLDAHRRALTPSA